MTKHTLTRRAFLAAATTTAAMTWAQAPNTAKVVPRKVSPNEKMNVAGIGAGGKGLYDIMNCRRENIVALCDVDWEQAAEGFYRNPDAKKYKDYRKMLEEMGDGIDACTVGTPDHTHAPAAYMAMKLGMHVYVEKPLTHTIAEARLLAETAREMGVATQMGNQGHSCKGAREVCEMVWSGAIGQVTEAHVWTNRPSWPQGIAEPLPEMPVPADLDWDLWLGTAPERPYNKGYAPRDWRGWFDFGCGALGDMACHIMDPVFWALKLGEAKTCTVEYVQKDNFNAQTFPTNAIIKYTFPARADMGPVTVFWYEDGNVPPRPAGIPENEEIGDTRNGSLLIGDGGFLTAGEYGGKARLLPEARMKDYTMPPETIPRIGGENHYRNWITAIKGGPAPCSNFPDYASLFTEVVLLGAVAQRTGRKLEWDFAQFKFTNDAEANRFVSKEYRKGWELPV